MRLIYTTHDADKGKIFATFLSSEGIENQLEMVKNTDWGTEHYGDTTFKIWVYDEDVADTAERWVVAFEKDPKNPQFQKSGFKTTVLPTILTSDAENKESIGPKLIDLLKSDKNQYFKQPSIKPEAFKTITISLLMLCSLFYLISSLTSPAITSLPPDLPPFPIVSAPIKKRFLYDYPQAYEIVDKLVKIYGIEKLQTPEALPPEGKYLLKELNTTHYWEGYYPYWIAHFQHIALDNSRGLNTDSDHAKTRESTTIQPSIPPLAPPLFEKIKQGEVWRLFTPCLMHSDILHILFNMLWLAVLGKQLEQRINERRYVLLILLIGIFSNTCQYLMSGPNFLGFSGVICGMVGFIWVRQKIAPWEGYPLEKSTTLFILYFITALFVIQMVSFYTEVYHQFSISPGIANTAHLAGAFIGALLGCLPIFKKNAKIERSVK